MNRPLVVLSFVLLAACKQETKTQAVAASSPQPLAVQTARAEARQVERALMVTGELAADETVSVSFEVGGRVAVMNADFGQAVRRGQVLAELDQREYQIAVDRARALLAQALARVGLTLDQAEQTPTTSPNIRQAEAQLADAKSKYDAAAKLIQTGDIARERFTEVEKAMQARQAVLDAARDELKTLTASVQSLRADLRLAEKRLADTVVRAPFDGAVAEKLVSPGQFIKDNATVYRVVKADPLRLRVEIPESATGAVRVGSELNFTTDAAPGQTFRATVRQLNPAIDQKSRNLTVEARLANPSQVLRPGAFVQVRLITERNVEITTVPKRALFNIAGITKMFAVRDGKAQEFRVPPGQEGADWVEVPASSVKPGELVAVSSLGALTDQAPVTVRR